MNFYIWEREISFGDIITYTEILHGIEYMYISNCKNGIELCLLHIHIVFYKSL
jgi:hypothetical protein